jgi:two-component system phosphate regulon response regulator OmpR
VVDDDIGLRETVADFLSMEGYAIREAGNVTEARAQIATGYPDLILLDINMPGGDGLSLAGDLRRSTDIPSIILSGQGAMVDRVVGLEVGADDYIAKPFELRELLARVRAVLRRARPPVAAGEPAAAERQCHFDAFVLMPSRRELRSSAGDRIDLTGAEYNLIAAFAERPNRVLTRDAIADVTRKDDWSAFDRSIDTLVSRLRLRWRREAGRELPLKTLHREGYGFLGVIEYR